MSKIGRFNMQLQEQAEELGFETVQEALDNGCVVGTELFGDAPRLVKPIDMQKKLDELEEAHEAWLKEKEKILGYIRDIQDMLEDVYQDENLYKKAVEIAKFIERGEV